MTKKEISLKVREADPNLVGKKIVAIDIDTKKNLGLSHEDYVIIKGKREAIAQVWPARPLDEGSGIIRMDSFARKNVGVSIGDMVTVSKAEVNEAKSIILAPLQVLKMNGTGYNRLLKKQYLERAVTAGEELIFSIFGSPIVLIVQKTIPKGFVKITENTEIEVLETPTSPENLKVSKVAYEDIGGLGKQLGKIRELIELPLRHPELFQKLGVEPPKGILMYGPPGTGKTMLAKAVSNEANAHFILINGPSIMTKYVGGAEERLRAIFKEAQENAPAIIFVDEIDAIAPVREEVSSDVEKRVVAQLLGLMDGMEARGDIIVIAATNRPNSVDPALRRPGRFDRELEIGVPDRQGRFEILQICSRIMPLEPALKLGYISDKILDLKSKTLDIEKKQDIENCNINPKLNKQQIETIEKQMNSLNIILSRLNEVTPEQYEEIIEQYADDHIINLRQIFKEGMIKEIAGLTHGFVGADLAALTKEAAIQAIRRILPMINIEDQCINPEILESLRITIDDFINALKEVQPSALREVFVEIPNVRWDDIGALEHVKKELKKAVEWPLKYPEEFKRLGVEPIKGVLLYGPPGTGKTMLAKAIANECESNFISVKGPELFSKWLGESERTIKKIFLKARQTSPCIVFFDEIDAIATKRGSSEDGGTSARVVNQLLTELDGLTTSKGVIFVAATNRLSAIDNALIRPGRIDKLIYLPLPTKIERLDILQKITRNMRFSDKIDFEAWAEKTDGFSGAELSALVRDAGLFALENAKCMQVDEISEEDLLEAYNKFLKEQELKKEDEKPEINYIR